MKKYLIIFAALLLLFPVCLCACDESEPLPEGVSALPDRTASEMASELDDGTGNLRWPAELLPEGFPMPQYTSIYSVEREDNALHIIMLGAYSLQKVVELHEKYNVETMTHEQALAFIDANEDILLPSDHFFNVELLNDPNVIQIWVPGTDANNNLWVSRKGWQVQVFAASSNRNLWLGEALKASGDAKYAWEIVFRYTVVPDSYYWTYPGKYENIGYPDEGVVEIFPAEYVPESLQDVCSQFDVVEMMLKKSGVRLAIPRSEENYMALQNYLANAGFIEIDNKLIDKDGNCVFFYEDWADSVRKECLVLLVRKPNDKIVKNEGGEES